MRRFIFSLALLCPLPAFAHSAERGFVLLLPTEFIIAGGAAVVAVTFLIMAMLRDETVRTLSTPSSPWFRFSVPTALLRSVALALIVFAVHQGLTGSADPARNLLPLSLWIGVWVVFVLAHPVLGHVAQASNPFLLIPSRDFKPYGPPRWAGWPALALFAGFAWFQLVYPAPEYPRTLAIVVLGYMLFTAAACVLFGTVRWLGWGDPFALMLRLFARCAPVVWFNGGQHAGVQWPGAGLIRESKAPQHHGVTFFLMLVLSAISFDALAATFAWQTFWGVNPLEFPGRTAMMAANTTGLVGSFALLAVALMLVTWLGKMLSGHAASTLHLLGRFSMAMLPISVAFHFSHYLTELLVNGQYLVLAWLNVLGLASDHAHVTTSFLNTARGAWTIYAAQTAAIVLGHVVSIAVAHGIVRDEGLRGRQALKLEAPMALLMVAYTGFGLWLLSTPTIA